MRKEMVKTKVIALLKNSYPYIIGLFPALNLYLINYFQLEFYRSVRTILVSITMTALVEVLIWVIVKKGDVTRVFTSFCMIVLLNYGALFSFLDEHQLGSLNLARVRYMVPFIFILFITLAFFLKKSKKFGKSIDGFFSLVSVILLGLLLYNFLVVKIQSAQILKNGPVIVDDQKIDYSGFRPNIYHIVLDGYTSSSALLQDFKFDNSGFENSLHEMGFVIPEQTISNYDETVSSLATALNMNWVENLIDVTQEDPNRLRLIDSLVNSKTRMILEDMGYQTFAFENEFRWALWTNADFYETPRNRNILLGSLNPYELIFLDNSIGRLVRNYDQSIFDNMIENSGAVNLDKVVEQSYILERLPELPDYITPKFVFAHLTTTHVPFVFDIDGSEMPLENQGSNRNTNFEDSKIREGYINSIQFTNQRIIQIVSEIIRKDPNAIIIIQGDHGYPGNNRNQIFIAIYDTKYSVENVDCLSPINFYRYIFNSWFGTNYQILDNNSYKTLDPESNQFELIDSCSPLYE